MKIVGIYLAAGSSRRMGPGIHKLCLPVQQTLLGNLALHAALASQLSEIIIVANEISWISQHVRKERIHVLSCPHAQAGQSYSLRCGIEKAESMGADGVIVILADQPFLTASLLNQMMDEYKQYPDIQYVAAAYEGIPRPPALFSKQLFPILRQLKGDKGARFIFSDSSFHGRILPCDDAKVFYDVDTWEDYMRMYE